MKKKISREELVEKRKQWQTQRELEKEIVTDIRSEEYREEKRIEFLVSKGRSRALVRVMNFVFAGILLEVFGMVLLRAFASFEAYAFGIHIGILVLCSVAALLKTSIIDEVLFKAFEKLSYFSMWR